MECIGSPQKITRILAQSNIGPNVTKAIAELQKYRQNGEDGLPVVSLITSTHFS